MPENNVMPMVPKRTSLDRTARLPRRLILAWLIILLGFAIAIFLRPWMTATTWGTVWIALFFWTSKIATLVRLSHQEWQQFSRKRFLLYLFWVGMRPHPFLSTHKVKSSLSFWLSGLSKTVVAAAVLWGIPYLLPEMTPWLVRVWIGVFSWGFLLLFGVFDLWTGLYRSLGVPVEQLWLNPLAATSLGNFWGDRWNRIFTGFARDMFFFPLFRLIGTRMAMLIVFCYSAVMHEIAWSGQVVAGFGGPTLYFLLHAALVQLECSPFGRNLIRRRPIAARIWTGVFVLGLLPLAVHEPYLRGSVAGILIGLGVAGI